MATARSQVPSESHNVEDSSYKCSIDNTVKGPVGTKFPWFEEANNFYMEYNFQGWRQNFKAYVIPPVYKIHSEEVPHEKADHFIPLQKEMKASDHRGQLAEEKILRAFVDYGNHHAQPMFIFHNFNFRSLDKFGKDPLQLAKNKSSVGQTKDGYNEDHETEADLIIVHREIGVILVETKSMKKFKSSTYNKAKKQLDSAMHKLRRLETNTMEQLYNQIEGYLEVEIKAAEQQLDKAKIQFTTNTHFHIGQSVDKKIFKVIACPQLEGKTRQFQTGGYIDLRMNHLNNFDDWWKQVMIKEATTDQFCKDIYHSLIPRLLCGRGDICIPLSIPEIAAKLDSQQFLKKFAEQKNKNNSDKICRRS